MYQRVRAMVNIAAGSPTTVTTTQPARALRRHGHCPASVRVAVAVYAAIVVLPLRR
jgi:hypothetical protein